jgi:hypothetical protein
VIQGRLGESLWTVGNRLATPRTFLLLRGSSVTERLRIAGNADWQEKRVPRCWPSVNVGTSGLEFGAGKPPPLHCQVLHAGALSGPPQRHLRAAYGNQSTSVEPQGRDRYREVQSSGTAAPEAPAGRCATGWSEGIIRLMLVGSNRPSSRCRLREPQGRDSYVEGQSAAPEALAGVLAGPAGARLQQGSCWSVPMVHREPPTAASTRWQPPPAPA